jgi:hypothetical protein
MATIRLRRTIVMSAWVIWMAAMGVFYLFALQTPFPASSAIQSVLRLNASAIGACVDIMIDFPVGWVIFLRICMEWIYFCHKFSCAVGAASKPVNSCLARWRIVSYYEFVMRHSFKRVATRQPELSFEI